MSMRFVSNRKGGKGDKNNLNLWHIMNGIIHLSL